MTRNQSILSGWLAVVIVNAAIFAAIYLLCWLESVS